MRLHSRNLIALMLSVIAAVSIIQATGTFPRPAFADESLSTSFGIGVTANQTITNTNSSLVASTLQTTNTSETQATTTIVQTQLQVDPTSRTIKNGDYARFNIEIHGNGTAKVILSVDGTPPRSAAIFTQVVGLANPEFHSSLIIVTSDETPTGSFGITIIAVVGGQEFDSQVSLLIQQSSTATTTMTSKSATGGAILDLSINTDEPQYTPNATVVLQGHLSDETGSALAGANVSLQVDGPTGAQIHFVSRVQTNTAGRFTVSFRLPADLTAGTCTVFASAAKSGYASATTHTTFVVGVSATPSVVISEVYTTDISGNRSAVFSAGQTALVWVVVENSGATFNGVIWMQIRDANGAPTWIQFQISSLGTGQTVQVAFGFQVTSGMAPGIYAANALVSDKLISQGGTFFASANAQFAVAA